MTIIFPISSILYIIFSFNSILFLFYGWNIFLNFSVNIQTKSFGSLLVLCSCLFWFCLVFDFGLFFNWFSFMLLFLIYLLILRPFAYVRERTTLIFLTSLVESSAILFYYWVYTYKEMVSGNLNVCQAYCSINFFYHHYADNCLSAERPMKCHNKLPLTMVKKGPPSNFGFVSFLDKNISDCLPLLVEW